MFLDRFHSGATIPTLSLRSGEHRFPQAPSLRSAFRSPAQHWTTGTCRAAGSEYPEPAGQSRRVASSLRWNISDLVAQLWKGHRPRCGMGSIARMVD